MARSIYFCILFLFYSVHLFSQDELNRDSVPPAYSIFTTAEELPYFPGGMNGLNTFFRKHFVYPAEAWKSGEKAGVMQFVVRADGVACGLVQGNMHPALYEELKRVFRIMPLWYPATMGGRPVNVIYSIDMPLYDYKNTNLPFHVLDLMKKNRLEENKEYGNGLDTEAAMRMTAASRFIVETTPENVMVASPLSRLLGAQGLWDEAVSVADSCARRYKVKLDIKNEPFSADEYTGNDEFIRTAMEAADRAINKGEGVVNYDYDGRLDIHAALTYALVCDAAGRDSLRTGAYAYALNVIDGRIKQQDVKTSRKHPANGEYRNLMKEKLALVMNPSTGGVQLNKSDQHDIVEAHTYGDVMDVIDRKIKEGKISNARVLQITGQLNELDRVQKIYDMGKDSLNLYGLRALTLYLSQGIEAQRQYMDSLSEQSKELKKYFAKMSENMQEHEAELSDRAAVIRSLACFAPINEEGDSKEEKKRRAKEFYRYRNAVMETYPLEWLWK